MGSLKRDIKKSSALLVNMFKLMNKELDYSIESVEHIETVLTEEFENGTPKPKGLFSSNIGFKLFSISSYIGEVVIKNTNASKWVTDDKDSAGEFNMKIVSANGTEMYPAHRVMNRIQNGEEDNLYHYTAIAVKNYMSFEGEIPVDFLEPELERKPWWKFW